MKSVEEPEEVEGKEMPQETGGWKNRLRKRHPKEIVSENPSKSLKRSQQSKIEANLHNNNILHTEIEISSKKPAAPKSKLCIKSNQGKIGQGKKKDNESSLIQNFHPEPKTIKQRMANQSLMKAYNQDYQDDIFESGLFAPPKIRFIQSHDSSSESFSSTDDFSSPVVRSPLSSPLSPPRLKREDTPEWYRKFAQENQVNSEEANSYKHMAFVHKSLKNQKVKATKRISTQVSVASSSKRMMKESLEESSREIASLSSSRPLEEESEECEEYFSEED